MPATGAGSRWPRKGAGGVQGLGFRPVTLDRNGRGTSGCRHPGSEVAALRAVPCGRNGCMEQPARGLWTFALRDEFEGTEGLFHRIELVLEVAEALDLSPESDPVNC